MKRAGTGAGRTRRVVSEVEMRVVSQVAISEVEVRVVSQVAISEVKMRVVSQVAISEVELDESRLSNCDL